MSATRGRQVVTVGLAVLGAWGFAGSTQHVLRLAEAHGQTGWLAWNVAGTVELLAVLAGWEIQVRARAGQPARFPKVLLGACVAFVIAANLAMADPTIWGYVVAVVPPACFFGAAGLIETRPVTAAVPEAAAKPARKAPADHRPVMPASPVTAPVMPAVTVTRPVSGPVTDTTPVTGKARALDVDDLVLPAQAVAQDLARSGQKVTRAALAAGLRARNLSCSTDKAQALMPLIREQLEQKSA